MTIVALVLGVLMGAGLSWLYNCQVVSALEKRIADLDAERKHFLDQLSRAALGVPMFGVKPESQPPADTAAEKETLPGPEEAEEITLRHLSRNPGKLAAHVTGMMQRQFKRRGQAKPDFTPEQLQEALDEIEALEKEVRPDAAGR